MEFAYEEERNLWSEEYCAFDCHEQSGVQGEVMAYAHWHHYIELIYLTKGEITATLNGKVFKVREKELLVINSREVHAIWGQADTTYICIKFEPELLYTSSHSIRETRYILPFITKRSSQQHVFSTTEGENTALDSIIRETMTEFSERKFAFEMAVKANIFQIFLWIVRSWNLEGAESDRHVRLKEKDMQRLGQVMSFLDEQYMNPITAREVAAKCNMNYSYFSRFFKHATGKSFTSYLNEIRLSEAEKLLIISDMSVTEIAMETGFASISYFISKFRTSRRLSPQQFRRSLRESDLISEQNKETL